tara:strand:+ start:4771 stop:6837 length:2067 start_codon:yes stop_codon:yes gene_type:complete
MNKVSKPAEWDKIYQAILEETGDKEKAARIATSRAGSRYEKKSVELKAPQGHHWMSYKEGPVLMVGDYSEHDGASEAFSFEVIQEHDPERLAKQESYKPPKGVREEAKRGLEMRREFKRGGTAVGVARARNLGNGDGIPLETINRMVSFFARHEVDLKAPKNRDRGADGYPGAGLIAWKLWGGDAGKRWADSISSRNKKSHIGKASKEYLEYALSLAKDSLPEWAYSKIHQAARSKAGGQARTTKAKYKVVALLMLSQIRPGILSQMDSTELGQVWEHLQDCFSQFKKDEMMVGRIVGAATSVVSEMRNREIGIAPSRLLRESQRAIDGQTDKLKQLNKTGVPIWNSSSQVVFVVSEANEIDKARGEFMSGPDGRTFQDLYLDHLKLRKSDVCILDVSQIDWLEKSNPLAVIALGRTAKRVLGDASICNLPHPKAVRRFGDSGEVRRKLKTISKRLTSHIENLGLDAMTINERQSTPEDCNSAGARSGQIDKSENETLVQVEDVDSNSDSQIDTRENEKQDIDSGTSQNQDLSKSLTVPIAKADSEKKIVYGVVLDPYQIDAQDDYVSPKAIEETAHDWLSKSRIIGFDHAKQADAYPVESSIIPYPTTEDYQNAMAGKPHKAYRMPFGDDVVHSGSWVLGTKLGDSEWDEVKEGKLNAYSIGGYGKREPMSKNEMPEVEFIELQEDR